MASFDCLGYSVVKVFVRVQKKRRIQKGRARGFYEGKYVYVRVRLPDGTKRDLYLGRPDKPASAGKPGVEKKLTPALSSSSSPAKNSGWRKRVEKGDRAALDTRELIDGRPDPRQQSLFERKKAAETWARARVRAIVTNGD